MMRSYRLLVCAALSAALTLSAGAAEPIRVAVLGDSISKNRIAMGGKGWPLYLGRLLGEGYKVETFSANGVDCLRVPSISIWSKGELPKLVAFQPNIAIIMLGANTAREGLMQHKTRYGSDYRATIDYLRAVKSKPTVYCCAPFPVEKDQFGIQGQFLHGTLDPIIRQTAQAANAPLIDCYTPLKGKTGLTGDGVHPNIRGMQAVAAVVYKGLLQKDPPADKLAELAREIKDEPVPTADLELPKPGVSAPGKEPVVKPAAENPNVARVVALTVDAVRNVKGDGPDGKGNTDDDTWGFWFELAHAKGTYARLDLATETMPADQRAKGVYDAKAKRGKGKVRGPIGSMLINPADSEGWIFHSDWDGRFEGAWGDKKANRVILYPYVEKGSHGAVAITYTAPATGKYLVTGKLTDLQVQPQFEQHDGASGILEVADGGAKGVEIARFGPFGDGKGRPDSVEMKAGPFDIKAGQLIRLVNHPNAWWGSDMTAVELRIERVGP